MKPVVSLIVLVALAASCGRGASSPPPARSALIDALCTVRDDLRRGDATDARRMYYDHAHDPLHALAGRVADHDRSSAGRLLEAHQIVEADLSAGRAGGASAGHVDTLVHRAISATAVVGEPEPKGCGR